MPSHRVILDTNVLVSGILFGGRPREVIRLALKGHITAYLSPDTLREFRDVIARPKFRLPSEFVHTVIEELQAAMPMVFPRDIVPVVAEDPDDDAVIACAVASNADFIITGDPHLLAIGRYQRIVIVTPAEYLDRCH